MIHPTLSNFRKPFSIPGLNNNKFKGYPPSDIKEAIEHDVCEFFEQDIERIRSKSRKRQYVLPRQVIMYLRAHYTDTTLTQIGKDYSARDHTTVVHSRDTIIDFLTQKGDSSEKMQINSLLYRYNYKVKEVPVQEVKTELPIRERKETTVRQVQRPILIDSFY